MDDLTFDSENHIYIYKGKRFPSVTQVLEPLSNYGGVSGEIMERARQYGTNLHEAIRLYLAGTLDFDALDENLKRPVEEFFKWFAGYFGGIDGNTDCSRYNGVPLCSALLKYAGTPDILIDDFLLELKTRPVNHCIDDLQVSAYEHLSKYGINRGFISRKLKKLLIELIPNQPLKVYQVNNRQAWSMFRYLLDRWWSEYKFNNLIDNWRKQ